MTKNRVDVAILGSGFSGSILAWILASQGRSVLLVDRATHPRFAIGESSTPTADFLLAHLADRWGLDAMAPLSCWGTWKRSHPDVVCGKKRGFSYYKHTAHTPFVDDSEHSQSLLVAASVSDEWSDTHWLRSSVDQFFAEQAQRAGVTLLQATQLCDAQFDRHEHRWYLGFQPVQSLGADPWNGTATWIVDASGSGNALAAYLENPRDDAWMRTRTMATYAHMVGVPSFARGCSHDDPFCGDDAAQHHVFDEGWCWMLRMDNGITSVGVVQRDSENVKPIEYFIERYPSFAELLASARRIVPDALREQSWARTGRMSRCQRDASGPGWAMLPVAYGFVDPLHSSGIAHALSGVVRLADALQRDTDDCDAMLQRYSQDLRREVEWLDTLVAGCYLGLPEFQRFIAYASYYFIAAVQFEKQLARDPSEWPLGFLQCREMPLVQSASRAFEWLRAESADSSRSVTDKILLDIRDELSPWNAIGLLTPASRNRIAHSVAPKYAAIASRKK